MVHEFFSVWAWFMSSFQHHVACLERKLWFRACILYIDPITCHFVIPLLVAFVVWLHPLKTSRQMCRITFNTLTSSEMSTVFMMRNTLLALDDFYYHRKHPWLPFIANLSTLWMQLALQLVLCSALKYYRLFCRECCGDCSTSYKFSIWWYFSPSTFFLGPGVAFNQDTNMLTMLFEFCTSINPIALKLTIDNSFLDCWLLNRHSNIDHAT